MRMKVPLLFAAALPLLAASEKVTFSETIAPILYENCVTCHGADAKGTPRGADLTDNTWTQISGTYPEIVQVITDGVPKEKIKLATATFPMRPRGGSNLSDDQIRAASP